MSQNNNHKFVIHGGLPRTGSTLLRALLSQNKKIYAPPGSPLLSIIKDLRKNLSLNGNFKAYPKDGFFEKIAKNAVNEWYLDAPIETETILERNREWNNQLKIADKIFDNEVKVICSVRNIVDICASFMKLGERQGDRSFNSYKKMCFERRIPATNYNFCRLLLDQETGGVGSNLNSMICGYRQNPNRYLFIEYEDLISNPSVELRKIYDFIGMDFFEGHYFENIEQLYEDNTEAGWNSKFLHKIRSKVEKESTETERLVTKEFLEENKPGRWEFWRNVNR